MIKRIAVSFRIFISLCVVFCLFCSFCRLYAQSVNPALTVLPSVLSGFTTEQGKTSTPKAYTLQAANLRDTLRLFVSAGYEISPNGLYYGQTIVLPPSTESAIIIVRMTGLALGAIVGTITHVSTGLQPRTIQLTGTVSQNTGITSIADARNIALNRDIIVQGVVTVSRQFNDGQMLYLQDKTGGMALFVPVVNLSLFTQVQNTIKRGNEIRVRGITGYQKGALGLTGITSLAVVNTSVTEPIPKLLTMAQLSDPENLGQLVRIDSCVIPESRPVFIPEYDFTFRDSTNATGKIRIKAGVNDLVNSLRPARKFVLTGILDTYDQDNEIENGNAGVRIYPRQQQDISGTTELVQSDGGFPDRSQTLEIAAWNVDSLGAPTLGASAPGPIFAGVNDQTQQENITSIIRYLNPDIMTLNSVSNPTMLTAIAAQLSLTALTSYTAICPDGGYYQNGLSKTCFLYKTTLFDTPPKVTVISTGMTAIDWDGGRFPVLLSGNVRLNGLSRQLNVIGIHVHEGPTVTDFMVRQRAAAQLKAYLDVRLTEPYIISGEFGDDITTSIAAPNPSPYEAIISSAASYSAITRPLSENRLTTSLAVDRMSTHILVTDKLFSNYLRGTVNTLSPDAVVPTSLSDVAAWGMSTSEYVPVFARFSLATPGSLTATLTGSTTLCGEYSAPLRVNIAGGISPYQLVISTGTGTTTISNYTSGALIPQSLTSTTSYSLVSVTDALSVTAGTLSGTATVTVIPNVRPVSVTISPASTSYCQGKTVSLSAVVNSGQLPLRYQWNSGEATPVISATATRVYQLTVIDGLGCTGIASMSTTVNTIPDLSTFGASVSALCTATGQVTTFTANIGNLAATSSYTLGSVTGSVSGTIAGIGRYEQFMSVTRTSVYTLTVGTPQGCTASATQSISLNATPSIVSFAATPSCAGRPSTFTALVSGLTGGYSYTLTDGSSNIFGTGTAASPFNAVLVPVATSTYSLVVANQNCAAQSTVLAQVGTSAPTVTLTRSSSVISCQNPVVSLNATSTGGVNYEFSPVNGGVLSSTNGFISVNQPGTYSVKVTDLYGCTATASTFVIADNMAPVVTLNAASTVFTCTNPTITLFASGGGTYSFYNPAGGLIGFTSNTMLVSSASGTGTYRVVVSGVNGCTAAASINLTANNSNPIVGLAASGAISCTQNKVQLTATYTSQDPALSYRFTKPGDNSFLVTTASNTIEVNSSGTYSVEITFQNGCKGNANVAVSQSTAVPGVTLGTSGQLSCSNPVITLSAIHTEPASRYEFSTPLGVTTLITPPANSVTANTTGLYTLKVTFQSGCSATASVNVTQSAETPTVLLQSSGQLSCSRPTVTLTAIHTGNALSYQFVTPTGTVTNGNSGNSITVSQPGRYYVSVQFSSGCYATSSQIEVTNQAGNVSALISGNTTVCAGASTILTVITSDDATVRWSTGPITRSISVQPSGTTPISVTASLGGCNNTASTTIYTTACAPLVLLAPTYNCSTGQFVFRSSGGDGTQVEYNAVGITGWSSNAGPYIVKPYDDASSFLLLARTTANPNTVVTYVWDWKAACTSTPPPTSTTVTPPSTTTTTPPSATTTTVPSATTASSVNIACSSPTATLGTPLAIVSPSYNCQTGALQFITTGGNGKPIEYSAIGITGWTANCQSAITDAQMVSLIRSQSPVVSPYILLARQDGNTVTLTWDPRTVCAAGGRERTGSADFVNVKVLGNPTLSEEVEVELESTGNHTISLYLTDAQGNVRFDEQIQKPAPVERKTIRLGRQAGMYLLMVKSGSAVKVVKILRQ